MRRSSSSNSSGPTPPKLFHAGEGEMPVRVAPAKVVTETSVTDEQDWRQCSLNPA